MEETVECIIENGSKEGSRNRDFYRVSCYYKAKGFGKEQIKNKLLELNEKTKPKLDEIEIDKILESADKSKFDKNPFRTFDMMTQAEAFIQEYPLFYDKSKIWWRWNKQEHCHEIIDETDILIDYFEYTQTPNMAKSSIQTELINALKIVSRKNKPLDVKDTVIQFKNKLVDIASGEYKEVSPKYFVTNPIGWNIGETEETPILDKLFTEWVGATNIQILYEIIAYAMLPSYPIHRMFCLIGKGRNGKGTFLNVLSKFIGARNCASTELDTLLMSRFETARLYKKLVCLMGETNFTTLSKTSIIKKLTGGDLIGYEFKNKDPFQDYNYAKIIIATNSLPMTEDKTDGFYSRWLIINFPNQFSEKRDVLIEIPDEEYENLAKKCIEILKVIYFSREFTNEGSIEQRSERYEDYSNPLQKFLKEKTIEDPNGYIFKSSFTNKFHSWQKAKGYREWNRGEIGKEMTKSFEIKKKYVPNSKDNERDRAWCGLNWKFKILDFENRQEKGYVQDVQDVQPNLTQIPYRESKLKQLDKLPKLDKHICKLIFDLISLASSDGLSFDDIEQAVHLKDSSVDVEKLLSDMKAKGDLIEIQPGMWKVLN